jgi:branched-chain amino acid transport system substrate-binding protein
MWFKLGETDFTSYITAIMAAKPDFLFGAIAGKDSETFLQQAGQMGLFKRVPFPGGLITVTELRQLRKTLPRGIIGLARCPFFAHLKEPLMQKYIKMHRAKFGERSAWTSVASVHYDAIYGLEQAINKAKSIETEAVVKALKGATLDTCRGKRTMRECSNQRRALLRRRGMGFAQLSVPDLQADTMIVVEGHDVWTPTCEAVEKLKNNAPERCG